MTVYETLTILTGGWALCGLIGYLLSCPGADSYYKRLFSRMLLGTPIWPILVIYVTLRRLIKDATSGEKEQ